MSDYSLTAAQKLAVYSADGEKCFYCDRPVDYGEVQIDHIVPEKISSDKLKGLQDVLPPDLRLTPFLIGSPAIRDATSGNQALSLTRKHLSTTFKWLPNGRKSPEDHGRI